MRRHLWREVRRQLAEIKGAGLVAFLLLCLGGAWALLVLNFLLWGQERLRLAQEKVLVVAVLANPEAGEHLLFSASSRFPQATARLLLATDVGKELGPWLGSGSIDHLCPALLEIEEERVTAPEVENWLKAQPAVASVQSSSSWTAEAQRRFGQALRFAGVLAGVLGVGFGAIVVLTVRFLVLSHADEIAIMRLIGAYENDIRAPYVVAHGLLGFLGGLGAVAVTVVADRLLRPFLGWPPVPARYLVATVALCTAVGLAGALVGVRSLPEEP
ncbi:MAG: FtsX-like permease family protein [Thermoanaerobaculaceae bacterium]